MTDHDISVPTTQCFINYLLLALTFGIHFATKDRSVSLLSQLSLQTLQYASIYIICAWRSVNFSLAWCVCTCTYEHSLNCFVAVCV